MVQKFDSVGCFDMFVTCFPSSDAQTALHATSVLASYAVLVSSFLSLYKIVPNPPTFFNSNKPQLCFLHLLHSLILSAKSLDANMNPPKGYIKQCNRPSRPYVPTLCLQESPVHIANSAHKSTTTHRKQTIKVEVNHNGINDQ